MNDLGNNRLLDTRVCGLRIVLAMACIAAMAAGVSGCMSAMEMMNWSDRIKAGSAKAGAMVSTVAPGWGEIITGGGALGAGLLALIARMRAGQIGRKQEEDAKILHGRISKAKTGNVRGGNAGSGKPDAHVMPS